ncbi:Cryptochrome-1 [Chionoecetes opilio]|uniref:Cryptochrome-1 n=1 Tax=Chionoecetes opilio TaxID=41210 RepID=A0A8J4YME9_CHIOP|nr:Cryptochrome-1 [Chionoecetes opilio]
MHPKSHGNLSERQSAGDRQIAAAEKSTRSVLEGIGCWPPAPRQSTRCSLGLPAPVAHGWPPRVGPGGRRPEGTGARTRACASRAVSAVKSTEKCSRKIKAAQTPGHNELKARTGEAMSKISVHWFRHGLRLHDNPALLDALEGAKAFYAVFIFDGESAAAHAHSRGLCNL